MKIDCKGMIMEWTTNANFKIDFWVDSEEERNILLDAMKDRKKVTVTVEVDE